MEILSSNSNQLYKLPDNREKKFLPLKPADTSKKIDKNDIDARKARLRKAAEGFEAIFARQILRCMRNSFTNGGMFGTGSVGEIYSDILDNAIAEQMSVRSALGLADTIYKQMVKSIEADSDSNKTENTEIIIKDRVKK